MAVMHGRSAERDAVADLLNQARTGRSGVLVLRGEAGIGKSTLLGQVAQSAGPATVLSCAGVESEGDQAFSGLHQLLRPVLGQVKALPEVQAAALRGALGLAEPTATDFVVAGALVALLAELAVQRPLVILVDDLQWLDRSSAAALLFAARRIAGEPIAMVFAGRDPGMSIVDGSGLEELRLSGLPAQDAAQLLGWELPGHLLQCVLAATGGNPRVLLELAALGEPDQLVTDLALTGIVPLGVRVRDAFLRAVPSECLDLLLIAAAEATGSIATVLGAARRLGVSGSFSVAERCGLVELEGNLYRFVRPLTRSAVYGSASFEQRCAVHGALAAELGSGDRAAWHRSAVVEAPDEALAQSLERSVDTARRHGGEAAAAAVLQRAARLSVSAEDRRRRVVSAAAVALDSGLPGLARALAEQVLAEPVSSVMLAQLNGTIELYGGDPALAYTHLVRCAELMADDDPEEAAWTLVLATSAAYYADDSAGAAAAATRIGLLDCGPATRQAGQWLASAVAGTFVSRDLWALVDALAHTQPETGGRRWMWALAIGWSGPDPHQALGLAEVAARQLRGAGSSAALSELLCWQADIEFRLGRWTAGVAHASEGLRCARETGQRGLMANLLAMLARFAAVRDDGVECRRYAERALAIALPLRHRAAAALATGALGILALADGQAEEAFATLAELGVAGSARAHEYVALQTITDLVEAGVRCGQDWAQFSDFAAQAERHPLAWVRAHAHRCRALVDAGAGAGRLYELALAAESAEDSPFNWARTALLYGEWLRRLGRRVEAREWLRDAAEVFGRLGAVGFARRAGGQLRAVGGVGVRRGAGVVSLLSPQELEVARLAAQGLSNREIGERLFLSGRTVGSHLYRLFPKLGVSARSQLRGFDFG